MRDNKTRTENHSPEFTDAGEERFSTAPEYAPVGQEFTDAAPEFMQPTDSAAYVPEEFKEGRSGETEFSSGKSKHRLLRKAGYLITAAVAAMTLANPGMNLWSGTFIEAENTPSWENEMEEPAETVLPADTEPEMTAQPTTEPEETAQPTVEPEQEEEESVSFIFSHMPVAAYEVTGLGVGRFESVNEEEIFLGELEEHVTGSTHSPLVRLTPGENTFVLFCVPGDVEITWYEEGGYSSIGTSIHSPSGSGQWEAITYQCLLPTKMLGTIGDFSDLTRYDSYYNEAAYDGRIYSLVDPWQDLISFAEIYHPDVLQDDAIYVIEAITYPDNADGYDEMDNVLARMVDIFQDLGATAVEEISVEEALKRCNVVVSESDEN